MLYQNLYSQWPKMTLVFVVLLSGLLPTSGFAQQSEAAIKSMLEQRDKDLKKILGPSGDVPESKKGQVRDLVNGLIDFEAMGEAAMGGYWSTITTPQKTEFVRVFGEIVRDQSLADVDIYRASVRYDKIVAKDKSARVTTTTTYKNVPARVEYDMLLKGSTWKARDIIIDDVSTVEGYSRSFQSVIRKKGFDALMNSLNKRLAKTRS